MKYRLLGVVPFVFAAVFSIAALALTSAQTSVLALESGAGKTLDFVGCLAAALAFERGDYLRRAWLTYGSCSLLLVIKDLLGAGDAPSMGLARGLLVVLANALLAAGAWMLARAWSVSGIEEDEPDRKRRRRLIFAAFALLSLGITGLPLVHDVRSLLDGHFDALVSIASDFGDAIVLALVAPVATTALAMRGGLLRWPWGYLTMAGVTWLAYDVSSGLIDAWHVGPGVALVASEALRAVANGFAFAAGTAQRMALGPAERLSAPPPPA